jgi:hypothetical protein
MFFQLVIVFLCKALREGLGEGTTERLGCSLTDRVFPHLTSPEGRGIDFYAAQTRGDGFPPVHLR